MEDKVTDPDPYRNGLQISYFGNPTERATFETEKEFNRPHAHPGSTLVVSCGTMWKPGCWQAVADMVAHTVSNNIQCWLQEIPDDCTTLPYGNLGNMRDRGVLQAMDQGFENVCLVDCDILPKPDLLINLLSVAQPIVAPLIVDENTEGAIGVPSYLKDVGVQPMRWVPMSLMLIKTTVFNAVGTNLFAGVPTEGEIFQKLWHVGHRPWMDTSQVLDISSQPTFSAMMPLPERWEWMVEVDKKRRLVPDRSGDTSKRGTDENGFYSPFRTENGVNNDSS